MADPRFKPWSGGSGTYPAGTTTRRRHARIAANVPVVIVSSDGEHPAIARDVGIGGMFLTTEHALPYGCEIVVMLEDSVCLPATVRWSDPTGLGVQFSLLGATETRAVIGLIGRAAYGR